MRKITQPAKICEDCGSVLKSEQYDFFCDNCKTKIPSDKYVSGESYTTSILWKNGSCTNGDQDFCSLKCVREWLLNFPYNKNEVVSITLPYIRNIDDMKELLEEKV